MVSKCVLLLLVVGIGLIHETRADMSSFLSRVYYRWTGNFEIPSYLPEGILIWGNRDIWYSLPPDDWNRTQPQYMAGYDIPVFRLIVRELMDTVKDYECFLREFIDIAIGIPRFGYCMFLALTWQDIRGLERPKVNQMSRYQAVFSKRERLVDRFLDSTDQELQVVRCVKRGLETVEIALWQIVKVFYYAVGKFWGRIIGQLLKIGVAVIHIVFPEVYMTLGFDTHYCFLAGYYIQGEELALHLKEFCTGFTRSLWNLLLAIMNSINEEAFVETVDFMRLFVDIDDKIPNTELEMFTNITAWRAADSPDRVRFDGTARIDRYYYDLSAKIMTNEIHEHHNTEWSRNVLLRAKEDWCMATFMPPTNTVPRVEFKISISVPLIKNDHRLDLAELRCLAIYVSRNLAYNSDPNMNTEAEMDRMLNRLEDAIAVFPRFSLKGQKFVHENYFLQGIHHMIRQSMHTMALQMPKSFFPHLAKIGKSLQSNLAIILAEFCPGSRDWRLRVNSELEIFGKMVNATEALTVPKLLC